MNDRYPRPLLLNGQQIGQVLLEHLSVSTRLTSIEVLVKATVPCPEKDNPNRMDEDDFQGLGRSIAKLDFGQPIAVGIPTTAADEDDGTIWRDDCVILAQPLTVLDGNHRREGALLSGIETVPAIWYRRLRPGEEKLIRAAFNQFRGRINRTVLHEQMVEVAQFDQWPIDMIVALSGADKVTLEAMLQDLPVAQIDIGTMPEVPMLQDQAPEKDREVSLTIPMPDVATRKKVETLLKKRGKQVGASKADQVCAGLLSYLDLDSD